MCHWGHNPKFSAEDPNGKAGTLGTHHLHYGYVSAFSLWFKWWQGTQRNTNITLMFSITLPTKTIVIHLWGIGGLRCGPWKQQRTAYNIQYMYYYRRLSENCCSWFSFYCQCSFYYFYVRFVALIKTDFWPSLSFVFLLLYAIKTTKDFGLLRRLFHLSFLLGFLNLVDPPISWGPPLCAEVVKSSH